MNRTNETLKVDLQNRWNYEPYLVDDVINKLQNMSPELQSGFDNYFQTNELGDEPKVFGLSPEVIGKNYPFLPPAVYLLLDWISKDPDAALNALVDEYHKPLPEEFSTAEFYEWKQAHQNKSSE